MNKSLPESRASSSGRSHASENVENVDAAADPQEDSLPVDEIEDGSADQQEPLVDDSAAEPVFAGRGPRRRQSAAELPVGTRSIDTRGGRLCCWAAQWWCRRRRAECQQRWSWTGWSPRRNRKSEWSCGTGSSSRVWMFVACKISTQH